MIELRSFYHHQLALCHMALLTGTIHNIQLTNQLLTTRIYGIKCLFILHMV